MRSDETRELLARDPLAFLLLAYAAIRARWKDGYNADGLAAGEALVGDHKAMGLTRQQYRTRLQRLDTWKFATNRTTNRGTVITITSTAVFDIFGSVDNQPINQRATINQPTDNHQITTNEEGKKDETEKKYPSPAAREARFSPAAVEEIYQAYPRRSKPVAARRAILKALVVVADRGILDPATWLKSCVQAYAKTRRGEDERFTPYPSTWFTAGSYDEEICTPRGADAQTEPTPEEIAAWLATVPEYAHKSDEWTTWEKLPPFAREKFRQRQKKTK